MTILRLFFALALAVTLAACSSAPSNQVGRAAAAATLQIEQTRALGTIMIALSPSVDPTEAQRAAEIAYRHTAVLAQEYQIEDGPIIHNIKVNRGTKPRGLCWHWAEDMEKRLALEGFETLQLHRAIANYDNWRLEHSTVIISAKGAPMEEGIVLDPWRKGGELFWSPVSADKRYDWTPRQEVFDWKRERGILTVRYVEAAGG
ncbi:MAG: hypothetical protein AAF672_10245 [Pseudomonadota bacterium]